MTRKYAKLSGAIVEHFGTRREFSKAMGLSERSISLKMRGKVSWKQTEMEKACAILGRPKESIVELFFLNT